MATAEPRDVTPDETHDDPPARDFTLDPKREKIGKILAFGGLSIFLILLAVVVFSDEYRIIAAFSAFVFFWIWKAGKTILRGNLNEL